MLNPFSKGFKVTPKGTKERSLLFQLEISLASDSHVYHHSSELMAEFRALYDEGGVGDNGDGRNWLCRLKALAWVGFGVVTTC
jgi:hypothetical protein